jgi:hypothetical protein
MKIIKASVDLETWTHTCDCNKCKSTLEVSSSDIRYRWSSDNCYYFTCVLCDHRNYLTSKELPEIVKTDVGKHRADPSPGCSDW